MKTRCDKNRKAIRPAVLIYRTLITLFITTSLLAGTTGLPAYAANEDPDSLTLQHLEAMNKPLTGDFDEMAKRRFIRVLIPYSKTFFFFDGAQARGASYEAVKEFEEFINKKLNTKTLKVNVIFLPTTRENLIPFIKAGKGDIAVGNLTITDERLLDVDFSNPVAGDINEILVSGSGAEAVSSLFDLAGKTIHARKSSSYYQSLTKLNETLHSVKKAKINIVAADDNLEDEDLLEMLNAGLIEYLVIDDYKGRLWAEVFDKITLHPEIKLRAGGKIAWALRKNNPKLRSVVNEFVKDHKVGTLFGNILMNRYLKNTSYITGAVYNEHLQRFNLTVEYFQKYGEEYDFDHLMLAALAYQESKLDQSLKSRAGAVGVMQILPSTAKDRNVGISDVYELDTNIHAGTKYLRFMTDNYFASDQSLDPLNRTLLTFASYNAGPAKVAQLRKEAEKMGLNPNIWFRNVEVVAAKRIGRETVQYVSNIFKYYIAYKLLEEKMKTDQPVHLSAPPRETKKKKK